MTVSDFASEKLVQDIAIFENLNFIDVKVNPITQNKIKYVLVQSLKSHNSNHLSYYKGGSNEPVSFDCGWKRVRCSMANREANLVFLGCQSGFL